MLRIVLFIFLIHFMTAHPWGGLVVDRYGNIYFTFVSPMSEYDHFACVWKIDTNLKLTEFIKSPSNPSDIVLTRSAKRFIYGAERLNHNGNFTSRLWKLNQSDYSEIISRTKNENEFLTQAYLVSDNGQIIYAVMNRLFQNDLKGKTTILDYDFKFNRIDDLAWGPDSSIFILDKSRLLRKDRNKKINIISTNLKLEDPDDIPFDGANIIFDMTVDEDGNTFLAYYGNRSILKISPNGVRTVFSKTKDWSPHGIDYYNGEIYILESIYKSESIFTFWKRDKIIPRIRKIDKFGKSSILYEYKLDIE